MQAAALAAAAVADTVALVFTAAVRRRALCLYCRLPWDETVGFEVMAHVAGTLDVRIAAALAHVEGPVPLIGLDTCQLSLADPEPPGLTTGRRVALEPDNRGEPRVAAPRRVRRILGARSDPSRSGPGARGGDVATDTGSRQLGRLLAAGLQVTLLRTVRQVDTPGNIAAVAALAPGSRVAAAAAGFSDWAPSSAVVVG